MRGGRGHFLQKSPGQYYHCFGITYIGARRTCAGGRDLNGRFRTLSRVRMGRPAPGLRFTPPSLYPPGGPFITAHGCARFRRGDTCSALISVTRAGAGAGSSGLCCLGCSRLTATELTPSAAASAAAASLRDAAARGAACSFTSSLLLSAAPPTAARSSPASV